MRREKYGQQSWFWWTPKPLFAIYALFAIYYIHVFESDSCKNMYHSSVTWVFGVSDKCRTANADLPAAHLKVTFPANLRYFLTLLLLSTGILLKTKIKMTVDQKLFSIGSNKNVKINKVTDIPVIFNPEWWLESLELVLWSDYHMYSSSSNCDFRNRVLTSSVLVKYHNFQCIEKVRPG